MIVPLVDDSSTSSGGHTMYESSDRLAAAPMAVLTYYNQPDCAVGTTVSELCASVAA